MAHVTRHRLGSVGDSAPSSDSSEGVGSETCELNPDWTSLDGQQTRGIHENIGKNITMAEKSSSGGVNVLMNETADSITGIYTGSHNNSDMDDVSSLNNNNTLLSDSERAQVQSFFSGLGTEIYVSSSLVNLYESCGGDDWRLVYTGIPVLLHDKGSTRSRTIPRVTFCLAERGTCFALWRDTIDNLSDYKVAGPSFHTMCLSSDHRQVIGFSFDSSAAAKELWKTIERLISDPENIALSVPGRKKNKQKRQKPIPLPPKSQISHPCQFLHVTSVRAEDNDRYFSLRAFAPQAIAKYRTH